MLALYHDTSMHVFLLLAVVWCWQDWMPSWDPLGVGRRRKDLGCWNFCLSIVKSVTI